MGDSRINSFDSDEELYFSWWLDELVKYGYVSSWFKNEDSYQLTDGLKHKYVRQMKRVEDKVLYQTILNPSSYTPDFKIQWTEKALGIFVSKILSPNKIVTHFICNNNLLSVDEIKGGFDSNNMTRLAINNIKLVWYRHEIYINMIKVPNIFNKTFTPIRYLLTDKSMKPRKIKYKNIVTLNEFINKQ